MGQWLPLNLTAQAYESADEVQLAGLNASIIDLVPIQVGSEIHLVKRPGLIEWIDLGTGAGIDGLYWHDRLRSLIAVSAGRVFKITDSLGTVNELLGSTALIGSAPVKFAADATRVVMANGGQMVYTDFSTLTTMADADAPTDVTHVEYLDGYILANDGGSGVVKFSDLNDLTAWQALSFFTAESKPDDVVAIGEGFREIITLGRETVEFWINDGQSPFSRISGSAQPFGTSAPHSLALVGSTWMWLDHNRRFATMEGRQVVTVSSPYDRSIQRYQSVNDAVGYAVSFEGWPLYVLNFPTAGETLVYNYIHKQWHRWGYWDSEAGNYERFRGLSYCYARSWNYHLIGDHSNGKVYRMSRGQYTDNESHVRSLLRTGPTDHGEPVTKRGDILRLNCLRVGGTEGNPQISMRRRVDNRAQWENERWKPLGPVGSRMPYIDWRRNGKYRTCQYEFVHSDDSDLVIMGAKEYVTLLGK